MPQRLYAHMRSPIGLIVAAYAAMTLIWSTTWLAIKVALTSVTPVAGSGVRFIAAGVLMYGVARLLRVDRKAHAPVHLIVMLAVAMFGLPYALTYFAETHLASGIVAVLYGTQPFFTFALAFMLLRERPGPLALTGAIAAFAGVAIISLGGDVRAGAVFIAATLAASLASAFANVYLKRFSHAEPLAVLPPSMLAAGIGLTLMGAAFEHPDWHGVFAQSSLAATLYLAVFGTAVAFYLNHWLLARISSGSVAMSALIIPVLAMAVGIAFGGEPFAWRDVYGTLLVIAGMWIALARLPARSAATLEAAA